ncbi:LPXTG cell wall anchor domain-containing protein [Streptomyces sp. NPDC048383]|uniref:LPXTG cell wall anchor domain-containing protein n=1 Tax=Streptomyces sp. NPDC048383 TaxID=3155386 RepID=UPI003430C1B4
MRLRAAVSPTLAGFGLALLALVQGVALAGPAHAHGDTLKVVVTGQRDGHVTADVTWENDGDPVDEQVAATVNSVSADGTRTEGPWRLVRDPARPAGWTTAESLPPGTWTVSVDTGFPALGHGQAEVGVPVVDPAPTTAASAPAPAPASVPAPTVAGSAGPAVPATPGSPASTGPSAPAPSAARSGSAADNTGWWTTAGVAGIALAGAAAGVLLRRRRRSLR